MKVCFRHSIVARRVVTDSCASTRVSLFLLWIVGIGVFLHSFVV